MYIECSVLLYRYACCTVQSVPAPSSHEQIQNSGFLGCDCASVCKRFPTFRSYLLPSLSAVIHPTPNVTSQKTTTFSYISVRTRKNVLQRMRHFHRQYLHLDFCTWLHQDIVFLTTFLVSETHGQVNCDWVGNRSCHPAGPVGTGTSGINSRMQTIRM